MNPSKFKNQSNYYMPNNKHQSNHNNNFKFSSKFSTSQPELPIFTSNHNNNNSNSNSTNNKQAYSNSKLNKISETVSRSSSSTELLFNKSLNALNLRNKNFLSQVEWSGDIYSLRNIIKYSKNPCSLSSSSIPNCYENNFPILVKVVKGNYGVIKEATSSGAVVANTVSNSISSNNNNNSSKSIQNLLLYSKTKTIFILCQSIKFNKDKKPFVYSKNISIPITYNGWFEILSEDGKSVKPLTSIKELYNHWSNANNFKKLFQKRKNNLSYIVRENITAYIIPSSSCFYLVNNNNIKNNSIDSNSRNNEKMYSSIDLNDCKSVVIRAGDILQIDGELYLQPSKYNNNNNNFSTKTTTNSRHRIKLIKCLVKRRLKLASTTAESTVKLIDIENSNSNSNNNNNSKQTEVLYLPEDTLGRYSPVARLENISGVHKLVDLVKKFRFPVTVQLVYGRAPPTANDSDSSSSLSSSSFSLSNSSSNNKNSIDYKSTNRFSPILKLLKIYEEENIFAYPVGKESCLIQIPTHIKLNMIKANNMGYLIENSSYIRSILHECKQLVPGNCIINFILSL
jgi:hypothetical protein